MAYRIQLTPAAERALSELDDRERGLLDQTLAYLEDFPRPIRGSRLVRTASLYGNDGFVYFDNVLPYLLYFWVDDAPLDDRPDFDGVVTIYFAARSLTRR